MEVSKRLANTIRYFVNEDYKKKNITRRFRIYNSLKARISFDEIKGLFFDRDYNKWKINKAKGFLKKEVLDKWHLASFLDFYFDCYFVNDQKGNKGAFTYVEDIVKMKIAPLEGKRKIRDPENIIAILEEYVTFHKKIEIGVSEEYLVTKFHNEYETREKLSTLKRKFFDK